MTIEVDEDSSSTSPAPDHSTTHRRASDAFERDRVVDFGRDYSSPAHRSVDVLARVSRWVSSRAPPTPPRARRAPVAMGTGKSVHRRRSTPCSRNESC